LLMHMVNNLNINKGKKKKKKKKSLLNMRELESVFINSGLQQI
jgi:hypothetical protein